MLLKPLKRELVGRRRKSALKLVGLGEALWDLLPSGKQLGGAPTNFVYASRLLGDEAIIASRVGFDEQGQEILNRLERLGLSTSYVQRDDGHPTGTVHVQVDERGRPAFMITKDVAWDYLEWTPQWQELAAQADAVCFGSLAQRSPNSRKTIQRFLQTTSPAALRVFDANLRQSFYTAELLCESLKAATIVKLNDDELRQLSELLKLSGKDERTLAVQLMRAFDLEMVCITREARGSLLVTEKVMTEHFGLQVKVADTIGAGDAFTAALVHCYLRRASLEEVSDAANRMGAWMATQVGATPLFEGQPLNVKRLLENH